MKLISFLVLVFATTGCGVNGALKATQAIPSKLDEMNAEVKKTNAGMDTTNAGMKQTNEGIEKTNAAVHKQTLGVALTQMLSEQNTRYLDTPTLMMPAGQIFADEADATEIAQFAYVMLADVNNSTPDPLIKNSGESDDDYNARLMLHNEQVNHDKFAEFTAVQIVVGLMSQQKTEAIVQAQIQQGGLYESTAYQILMLRHEFIRNTLLESSLFENKITNIGQLSEAVKLARFVDYIERLPFADKIAFKVSGMQMPVPETSHIGNMQASLDTQGAVITWRTIAKHYDRNLGAGWKLDPAAVQLRGEVNQKISEWESIAAKP